MFSPGLYISSTALQNESIFEDVIILITEYNEQGATGFVINKPFGRKLNELEEFSGTIDFPLNDGGPVSRENIYFIHRRPDLISGGVKVANGIYLGRDFNTAVSLLSSHTINKEDIKIFIGYCGWDAGDLETETAEGNWVMSTATTPF